MFAESFGRAAFLAEWDGALILIFEVQDLLEDLASDFYPHS